MDSTTSTPTPPAPAAQQPLLRSVPPKPPAPKAKAPPRIALPKYHEALLEGICTGSSLKEAALAAKVPYRCAQRWASRFSPEIRKARSAILDGVIGRAHSDLPIALGALRDLASVPGAAAEAGASVRKSAASALVDAFVALVRIGDMDSRLSKIEDLLAERLGGPSARPLTRFPSLLAGAGAPQAPLNDPNGPTALSGLLGALGPAAVAGAGEPNGGLGGGQL